ncbi:Serine/threonine protein kinase [Streptomyces sp. 3213]|uniref:serine/threonine-protein kinase n=1 Tax=Streptomyces sp. 3213.3 TaxID=1855348 RepID=UPI00089BB961|nr:serine/threonine-protein kinase [Streptomyces sp. 3213.3]SEC85141.1 Serine/threonine protein kinase [Streptomyces sp. 3213] [Streptomyces sp. 3213.3]
MPQGSPTSGVGRVIAGRYLLLNRLGSGGMGHVWLAHDQRLACEVALKEIVFSNPASADAEREARVARAQAEARHAAGLRGHPHVVTVHDVLEHDGLPWIVMEYVADAVDLRDLVGRQGPLAPAECARIGLAVLDALTAGHERGVMHRDVKPANILLAPDRTGSPYARVLLTDYGISVQPDAGETRYTLTSVLVGTAGYLAPERATGGPPTAAADLFSLGCTLYHAVEGHGPFTRESPLAEVTAVVMEDPLPPARAGALAPVLHAMLEKDPLRRIPAAEAEAALSRIVTPQTEAEAYARTQTDLGSQSPWEGLAVPVAVPVPTQGSRPYGWVPPPGRRRRARPRLLQSVPAGLLGLVLALGGVWYAMAHQPPGKDTGKKSPPYGTAVGLSAPLEDGDCVTADWPGGRLFQGTPRLAVDAGCRTTVPDGQVMGFVSTASAGEARKVGADRCARRTQEIREKLADVRGYAVVPTDAGFAAAGRRTACLVLGAHGPVYGPLGSHRALGSAFADTSTMQKRDCLDVPSNRAASLVSCAGKHDQVVVGFTRLGADVTLAQARTRSDAACARDVPPADYGFDPSVYQAASWTSEGPWKSGTHFVVCAVRKQNGGTMEGDGP